MLNVLIFVILLNVVHSYINLQSSSRMMLSKLNAGEMSKALPFITKPAALDGKMIGDYGFDPLGFSEQFSLKYMGSNFVKIFNKGHKLTLICNKRGHIV